MALQVFTRGMQLDREQMKWSRNKPFVGYSRCGNTKLQSGKVWIGGARE